MISGLEESSILNFFVFFHLIANHKEDLLLFTPDLDEKAADTMLKCPANEVLKHTFQSLFITLDLE